MTVKLLTERGECVGTAGDVEFVAAEQEGVQTNAHDVRGALSSGPGTATHVEISKDGKRLATMSLALPLHLSPVIPKFVFDAGALSIREE